MPLLVTGPGLREQRTSYDPVSTVDVSATVLDLARARAPRRADGHSMVTTLYGTDAGWSTPVLYESIYSGGPRKTEDPFTSVGVRTARFMYVHRSDGEHMLFDLARDPLQNRNVARTREYADVVRQLKAVVRRLRHCDGSGCQVRLPSGLAVDAGEAALSGRRVLADGDRRLRLRNWQLGAEPQLRHPLGVPLGQPGEHPPDRGQVQPGPVDPAGEQRREGVPLGRDPLRLGERLPHQPAAPQGQPAAEPVVGCDRGPDPVDDERRGGGVVD